MKSPIDIRPNDLEIVQNIIINALPKNVGVWVFGSRAKWTTKDSSDLDLAIDAGRKLTKSETSKLEDEFNESNLPYKVDFVDLHNVSQSFKEIIEKEKVEFSFKLPLGQYITLQRGFDLPKDTRDAGIHPVIASTGINGFHNEYKVKAPGVVIGRSGSIGGAQYVNQDFWPLNTTLWVKEFNGHPQKYVYYQLKNIDFKQFNSGTGVPTLNRNHIAHIEVVNLGKKHEKLASKILGDLDDKISLNQQINQTLEAMAQAVFKSWFVDFEPVKAKAAALAAGGNADDANLASMQLISGKSASQLAELKTTNPKDYDNLLATAKLFPHRLTPSSLGDIPEGWEVKRVSNFGEIICGKTPSKSKPEYFGSEVPFIKIPDMHASVFISDTNEYLSNLGAESQKNKYLPKGSVCVSCIATVGKVVITSAPSQTNQQINSIIPKRKFYTTFIYFYMKNLEQKFHDLASGGSTTLNMNTTTFSKIEILKPSDETIEKFDFILGNWMERILKNDLENKTITQIRDSLLPKLLSGEIDTSALNLEGAA